MNGKRNGQKLVAGGLWILTAGLLAVAMAKLFEAGAAGDVKTGACGNPELALHLENQAVVPGVLAALLAGAAWAVSTTTLSFLSRVSVAPVVAAISALVFWAIGLYVEGKGIERCYRGLTSGRADGRSLRKTDP